MKEDPPLRAYASFTSRVLAFNIDLVVLLAIAVILGFFTTGDRIFYSLMGIIYLVYHFIFEATGWRGSLGKRMVGIEVITDDYRSPEPKKLASRSMFKLISALPLFLGFAIAAVHPKHKTLHDIMSGCIVVKS